MYVSDNILLSDGTYYKYIFKKTEKIVCAIFYVLGHAPKSQESAPKAALERDAQEALNAALATLSCRAYGATEKLYALVHALVALESKVHVGQAAGLLESEIADMFALEIEAVLRTLRQYLARERRDLGLGEEGSVPSVSRRSPISIPRRTRGNEERPSKRTPENRPSRRDTIKDILAEKGQVTIKDIADKMPEYSEKTIQRELISMIGEGVVAKEGERRWSRYSLIPGA